jgi:hypothetical protein
VAHASKPPQAAKPRRHLLARHLLRGERASPDTNGSFE